MSAIYALKSSLSEPAKAVLPAAAPAFVNRSQDSVRKSRKSPHTVKEKSGKWNVDQLRRHKEKLNQIMDIFGREIRFFVNSKDNKVIIKIIDSRSGEVIRQIPPEKMINFVNRIDNMIGIVLDEKV
ncbi:flagellar protein FlaG [bacterium BMS3Abin05]|nr:flagellar protein FlaG [bacterium BMS3Abin05]